MSIDLTNTQPIGIVGLGLIGGSLGLDFRAKGLSVIGVSRQEKTCKIALERGSVTVAGTDFSLLASAKVIFICTPISLIVPTIKKLIPYLKPETIITDVASVKEEIVTHIDPLWNNFIGGHPMAGTAEQGIESALKGLFKNAPYILTPTQKTSKESINTLTQLVQLLGSKLHFSTPTDHDQAVAWISHLPVMISASLIQSCLQENHLSILELGQKLASSGFKDTSRVGGGNPELGVMMAQHNRTALLHSLKEYKSTLEGIITLIEEKNWSGLDQILQNTKKQRSLYLK